MRFINKITSDSIVDFAAEELKRYLRMMMPNGGDIRISYNKEAEDGFRLGTMDDLGLDTSDIPNTELDDAIYLDCTECGGIIAGSNPRSVLLAVYEYLRQNGCRWLMPGIDGEFIPMQDVVPLRYRHVASSRIRGNCIEGALTQQLLNDFIDFLPKVGLNTFMVQFRIPATFYTRYYNHDDNTENFAPEAVSTNQIIQWNVVTECEMAKRGLILHSYGHGFTTDPFGIDSAIGWGTVDGSAFPAELMENFAMLGGVRGFFKDQPLNTQLCLSNKRTRATVADYVASYAAKHSNIDYLHIWLADAYNNHCECEECRKMTPSDYYVVLMNEIDEALTKVGSSMRLVVIAYVDTLWAPVVEKLKNPDRFVIMIAPITRDLTKGYGEADGESMLMEYKRNKLVMPMTLEDSIEYYKKWERAFSGDGFVFEYHFWHHQHYDLSGQMLARRIYDDISAYRSLGFSGIIECGSQRDFLPNGFAFYTHARALFDSALSFDDIKRDYYSTAYGEDYEQFDRALAALSEALPFDYFSPAHALRRPERYAIADAKERFAALCAATDALRALAHSHRDSDIRARTLSVRLLDFYCDYVEHLAAIFECKANLDDAGATAAADAFIREIGKHEATTAPYFDHAQLLYSIKSRIIPLNHEFTS